MGSFNMVYMISNLMVSLRSYKKRKPQSDKKYNFKQRKTRWSCYRVKLEQRENCQEFQLTGVLEFRIGVLKIGDQRWDIGKGEVWVWDNVLNLIVISVS